MLKFTPGLQNPLEDTACFLLLTYHGSLALTEIAGELCHVLQTIQMEGFKSWREERPAIGIDLSQHPTVPLALSPLAGMSIHRNLLQRLPHPKSKF